MAKSVGWNLETNGSRLWLRISNSDSTTSVSGGRQGNPNEGVKAVAGRHFQNGSLEPHHFAVDPSTLNKAGANKLAIDSTQDVGIADRFSSGTERHNEGHPCLHAIAGRCTTKHLESINTLWLNEPIRRFIRERILRRLQRRDDQVVVSQHGPAAVHDRHSVRRENMW